MTETFWMFLTVTHKDFIQSDSFEKNILVTFISIPNFNLWKSGHLE